MGIIALMCASAIAKLIYWSIFMSLVSMTVYYAYDLIKGILLHRGENNGYYLRSLLCGIISPLTKPIVN